MQTQSLAMVCPPDMAEEGLTLSNRARGSQGRDQSLCLQARLVQVLDLPMSDHYQPQFNHLLQVMSRSRMYYKFLHPFQTISLSISPPEKILSLWTTG